MSVLVIFVSLLQNHSSLAIVRELVQQATSYSTPRPDVLNSYQEYEFRKGKPLPVGHYGYYLPRSCRLLGCHPPEFSKPELFGRGSSQIRTHLTTNPLV